MTKKKYLIIDDDTGEIVDEVESKQLSVKATSRIAKREVDKMINNAKGDILKIDVDMLVSWCMSNKYINEYNQVRLDGSFKNKELYDGVLDFNFGLHVLRCINTINKYSCFMKRNHNQFIENWTHLWETVSIKDKRTQQSVKKFLLNNKLVREYKHVGRDGKLKNKFIVNPFLFRESTYVSEIAVSQFQDFVEEGKNMSQYIIKLLEKKEVIDIKKEKDANIISND